MPCYDERDRVRTVYEKGFGPSSKEEIKRLKAETKRLSARCEKLTELLCSAGRARYRKTNIPASVLKWWEDHCKLDRKHGEPW